MKQPGSQLLFGAFVGALNLAVIGMFYVVTTSTPITATPSTSSPVREPLVAETVPPIQGVPVHISIPSLAIDLPIGVGVYDSATMTWTVDDLRAYYVDMSVPANNSNGTTLVYGHAQAPVFARLPEIKVGAEVIITSDNGYVFRYRYRSMVEVVPTDLSVLHADGPPILVLQTCTGLWSAYRGLFSFTLESVEST